MTTVGSDVQHSRFLKVPISLDGVSFATQDDRAILRIILGVREIRQSLSGLICVLLLATICSGQQHPIVPIGGLNSPRGCLFPFQDNQGRLWLAGCETGREGIYLFDGKRFLSPEGQLNGAVVRGMAEDSEGGIWLSSSLGLYRIHHGKLAKIFDGMGLAGIARVAPDVFLLTMRRQAGTGPNPIEAVRVTRAGSGWRLDGVLSDIADVQFRPDGAGNVLYGCDDGYCELSADEISHWQQSRPLTIRHHALGTGSLYSGGSAVVLRDRQGCVWLRNAATVSYQCPKQGKVVQLAPSDVGVGYAQLYELEDGTILIPGYSKITFAKPEKIVTLNIVSCGVVIPLRDGGLVSNGKDGLFYFPRRLAVEFWTEAEGLGGTTWSLIEQREKMYTQADNATRTLDENRMRWRAFPGPAGHLVAGVDGTIFVATGTRLYQMDSRWHVLASSKPTDVRAVFRLPDDSIWAAGKDLYRVRRTSQGMELDSAGPSPAVEDVAAMSRSRDGTIWACGKNGLARLNQTGWQLVRTGDEQLSHGCESLAIEADGSLWFSAFVTGTFYHVEQPTSAKSIVTRYSPKSENGGISRSFTVDPRGWIWRGDTNGLYVADSQQARSNKWINLGTSDVLPTMDTNLSSFLVAKDGSIWFGADNDVIHLVVPEHFVHPSFAPLIAISGFSSDGSPLRIDETEMWVKSDAVIDAHLGSLQYDRRNALHMRYRLLPGKNAWSETDSFDLSLGKLRWGRHTLQVQAQLVTGPWSPVVEQSLTVQWPVWLSWPWLLLYGSSGTGICLGAAQWNKRRRFQHELTLPDLSVWRMGALSPETDDLLGTCLDGRYEIGHILSVGGFATVARARDLQHDGQLCAVKIFRYEFGDRAWIRHRFEQEISALESVSHPNIVRITGHGALDTGAPYLVMEFVQGHSLREQLQQGALSRRQIGVFLRQIAGALQTLHRKAIYHRDLKPENLMIRSDIDGQAEIVLIDFSIAIVKSRDQTFHGISRVAGTLEYMAPEQVIGFADASTDIYALAKIIMEMLTGSRWTELFPEATLDLPEQIRNYFASNPMILGGDSIKQIVSAMAFDPGRRPKEVVEFAEPIVRDLGETL